LPPPTVTPEVKVDGQGKWLVFLPDCVWGCSIAVCCSIGLAVGDVLGTDYNSGYRAAIIQRSLDAFFAAVYRNAAWRSPWGAPGRAAWANPMAYGLSIFILLLLSAATHVDRTGFRIGSLMLTIIMLIQRTDPVWRVALERFAEVSVGILVALFLVKVWPEAATEQSLTLHSLTSTSP